MILSYFSECELISSRGFLFSMSLSTLVIYVFLIIAILTGNEVISHGSKIFFSLSMVDVI